MQENNKSCKNCLEMKRGECIGKKSVCDFYKYAPPMTEEKKKNWPEYGDATSFKLNNLKKRFKR